MPLWRQVVMLGAVVAVTAAVAWIAPRYLRNNAGIPDYIVAHTPFFFVLIALEMAIGGNYQTEGGQYELADSFSSLSAGTLMTMGAIVTDRPLMAALGTYPYKWIFDNIDIGFKFEVDSALAWIGTVLFVDFGYYWFHRAGHEISIVWASHHPHHSSEHYNLTTSLRQGVFQRWFSWVFYLPMALVFPPYAYLVIVQANTLYQFWIHTTCIRRLGFLEWFFNTPSAHRVHHDRRVHCNYGGFTMIWDRLFGTFVDEEDELATTSERVVYGVLTRMDTWNPVYVQLYPFWSVFEKCMRGTTLSDKIKAILIGPGYRPNLHRNGLPPIKESVHRIRYRSILSTSARWYIFFQFAFLLLIVMPALALAKHLSIVQFSAVFLGMAVSLWLMSTVLDGHRLRAQLEALRCLGMCAALVAAVKVFGIPPQFASVMHAAAVIELVSAALVSVKPSMLHVVVERK